ncbi:hypothetical protein [Xanthomonas arboricola]|uniref:hypothetical protein n=1 Tax=Xanthomonas arboricola TaxID=56448 RepID=UPI0011B025B6|nr:hypothetical protein [Xanthomonas arboricola]
MAKVNRTLLLKRVEQRASERFPELDKIELHTWMSEVFKKSETVWDRHYPAKEKVQEGRRCIFFKQVERKGKAILFNAYSYISGLTPDQITLDELAEKITAEKILDSDGNSKEIAERFAIIVVGEVMIMEAGRVPNSGPLAITAMREMMKRHTTLKIPRLVLSDAPTLSFKQMAAKHGGVDSVTARLARDFVAEPDTFGDAMETIVTGRGFENVKVTTTIESADGVLDVDKVEQMLDESIDGTGLSGITVRFKDGRSLGDMEDYREKTPIEVNSTRPGIPNVNEVEAALVNYLTSLVKPDADNFHLIDSDGMFT